MNYTLIILIIFVEIYVVCFVYYNHYPAVIMIYL